MLKRIIPSLFYSIDLDTNEVVRPSGKETDSLKQTKDSVRINLYDIRKVVKKEWLKWLAYYVIALPLRFKNRIWDIRFYDHKLKSKVKESDKKIVVFKSPLYVDNKQEFRLLARYPDYAISKDGRILEVNKNKLMEYDFSNSSNYIYPTIRIFDRVLKKSDTVRLHRLVALAWCENKDFISKPIVNHKDKNRHNFHADNLEWISYSGNTSHVLDDTVNYNVTYKIRNIDTGEIKYLESLTEASKYMGRSRINTVHTPLKRSTIWEGSNGKFELKLSTDKSPWLYDKAKELDNKSLTNKYIVKYKDGKKEYFRNRIDLNKTFLNFTASVESEELIKKILSKRLDIDYINKIEVSNINNLGYQAMNIKTKEIYAAPSHSLLAKLTGLGKSTITKAITLGDTQRVFNNFIIRNYSNDEWNLNNLKIVDNKPKSFNVYENKNLIDTISSLRELSKKYNLERHFLMHHFKNNNKLEHKNYIIEKYD